MEAREGRRLRYTRQVLCQLKLRDFRNGLPPLTEDGSAPVVVGLPDDTIDRVCTDVYNLGGAAYLLVPVDDVAQAESARFMMLRMEGRPHVETPSAEREHPASEDSHLGMLLELIKTRGGSLTFHVRAQDTTVHFLDDGTSLAPVWS